jgi:glutamate N-acetyltransferase/amino-acid N-acetyltransferase
MRKYKKAILPKGFLAGALACGIKKANKLDLALFYSQIPAKAACKFTSNKIVSSPIKVNKLHLKNNRDFRAIIVNSGNANSFTGTQGIKDAKEVAKVLGGTLKIRNEKVLFASTGIIGRRLPVDKIKKNIPKLISGLSVKGINKAKLAILTTDSFTKEITVKFNMSNKIVTICGIAKGAGMIAPNIATMLAFIFTDANIAQKALIKSLSIAVESSFNCITVDGCMSTNDSIMVLANGAAKNSLIERGKNFNLFLNSLGLVCLELAKMIIRDAEGATKFIKIKVRGARNFKEAKTVGLSISNSSLFKTAMYASSPNVLGRIVAGIGASGININEKDLKIKLSPLKRKDVDIDVSIGKGESGATIYTSDLTPEYIKINAQYN